MGSPGQPVSLGELAIACYAYDVMTGYGKSLRNSQERLGGGLDLDSPEDRLALLRWLNSWGCRNLALAYHELASSNLARVWKRVQHAEAIKATEAPQDLRPVACTMFY